MHKRKTSDFSEVCGGRSTVERSQSHIASLVLLGGLRIGLSMTPAALSLADRQDKSRTGSNAILPESTIRSKH